jgi:membrane fusion protein (multidrug efflux system)
MPVIAHAREYGDKDFSGTVSSIDSQIDPVTRSILVRAEIPNAEHILKPGLLMSVTLLSNQRDALIAPEESIIPEGHDKYVLVVGGDNKVEKRKIETGTRRPGEIEIISGLDEGEKIIARGTINVQPGQTVSVMAEKKGDEPLSEMLGAKDDSGGGKK